MPKVKHSSSPFTPSDYPRVSRLLMRRDYDSEVALNSIGECGFDYRQQPEHLIALTRAIVGQQLSAKAAATIFSRFVALFPDANITADRITALDDRTLRAVGLSSQKLAYMRDLSA